MPEQTIPCSRSKSITLRASIISYGYAHAHDYVSIPNIVYKSLDVRYTVFSTIANFVNEMTLGQVVTLPSGQVVTLSLWSR